MRLILPCDYRVGFSDRTRFVLRHQALRLILGISLSELSCEHAPIVVQPYLNLRRSCTEAYRRLLSLQAIYPQSFILLQGPFWPPKLLRRFQVSRTRVH
jgi:hypothetical protein